MTKLLNRPLVATTGGYVITELDGRWWGQSRNGPKNDRTLVMNAVLRIDGTTLVTGTNGKVRPHLVGRLIHDGDVIPFEVVMSSFKSTLAVYLPHLLATNKPGAVLYLAPDWGGRIIQAGMLLGRAV